jgi:hypothetical protein
MQLPSFHSWIKNLVLVGLALPMLSTAHAAATPARFGDALNQLTAQVKLPQELEGGHKTLAVYCQTDVAATGMLANTQCYQHPKIANLEQQTLSALESVKFEPATVDGEAVPVRMQFRVVYSRSGDQPDMVMLPNLGTLQNEHGVNYFAPQERLDKTPWYQQYLQNERATGKGFFDDGRLTRVMGTVETSGEVGDINTLDARGSGKRDAGFIEKALKQSRFIPGFVNNNPVEMHYVAVLSYAN